VLAANRVDIEYATLARAKTTNPEVLAFAKRSGLRWLQRRTSPHSTSVMMATRSVRRCGS
jgi:hypothetical protein